MRPFTLAASAILLAGAATLVISAPAAAHVVPSTTIELDVHESDITAHLTIPAADLEIAAGTDLAGDVISAATAADLIAYLEDHFSVTSASSTWAVSIADLAMETTEQWGTESFSAVTATATLTPSTASSVRSFTLDYDAVIHQIVTADIIVLLSSDWQTGAIESSHTLGTIAVDTVTGEVPTLPIELDEGSAWQGFVGMVGLGLSHIAEGTDHQLFLLTLLLPAPLLVAGGRWAGPAPVRRSVRRITVITLAFTLGHSVTLALGAFGLAVPQQPVEALIAVSILVAAVHAWRPLFPGKEAVVAAGFGLVHGMAFSTTLAELGLSGGQLVISLVGFNLGIELMQLLVVALVLPPLVLLARTRASSPLRIAAAVVTALAATGWLLDRLGFGAEFGIAADAVGVATPWLLAALWAAAIMAIIVERRRGVASASPSHGERQESWPRTIESPEWVGSPSNGSSEMSTRS